MSRDYWLLVEPVWDSLVQWDEISGFQSTFASTDLSARTLFAAHWLYTEVCNGGFHQFYWNSTGVLAPEAADAYSAMGMPRTAEVIRRSIAWFRTPYPRDRGSRIEQLDRYAETHPESESPFAPMDDEFYQVAESENGGFLCAANAFAHRRS